MFILYCFMVFASQFKHILSFNIMGVYINPVRISFAALILFDIFSHHGKFSFKKKNNIWLMVLLAWNIWSLISFLWVKEKSDLLSTEIILFEALGYIYYAQQLVTTRERAASVINMLLAACVVHNALGWMEITTKIYLFTRYTEKYSTLGYPVSTFTNTNNYGFYLALMCVVLVGIVFVSKNKLYRLAGAALLASSLLLLFKTGSRGAIIDVFIGMIFFALLLRKNLKFTLVIGSLVVAVLILMAISPEVFTALEDIYQKAFDVNVNAASGSDYYRMNMLENGMDFYASSYGFGIGAGNIEYWMEHYGTRFTNNIFNIHNWWIEILVGSGTVMFILVAAAWIITYKNLIHKYIIGYRRNFICTMITFGIVYGVGCISPSTLYSSEWPWMLLALFFYFSDNTEVLSAVTVSSERRKRLVIKLGKRALSI